MAEPRTDADITPAAPPVEVRAESIYQGTVTVDEAAIERVEQYASEQGFRMEPWQSGWLRSRFSRMRGGRA